MQTTTLRNTIAHLTMSSQRSEGKQILQEIRLVPCQSKTTSAFETLLTDLIHGFLFHALDFLTHFRQTAFCGFFL